ncbi:hypothetical protein QM459_03440 [Streptococcus parasanguinis]
MTRPNRYPYTKSQWEEVATDVCLGDEKIRFTNFKNRLTGETKQ